MGQLGDLSPGGSVAVGVVVGLVSTSVQSIGLTLQRKSHILEDEKAAHVARRPPYRRRRWQLGMLMFIISNLAGSTIQITTLPLPVLSTLQASGLVFNSICATLILGEPFTRYSLAGTILVCAGAVLIATFGALTEPAHDLSQLLHLLSRTPFILWMISQAVLIVLILLSTRLFRSLTHHHGRIRLFRGIAYGAVSGILSAHCLLVAKSAVELLIKSFTHSNQFNRLPSWLLLLLLISLALTQLYYLHRGLKLVSTSVLYPLVFCVYNIIAILDGLIYFRQGSRLSVLHAILIALGTIILLAGVVAFSWRLNTDPTAEQPQVAQSALAPGLGVIDDVLTESENEEDAACAIDEEAAELAGEHRPLLGARGPLTPTTKADNILAATKPRRRGILEVEEIWGELEDSGDRPGRWSPRPSGNLSLGGASGPNQRRRASTLSFGRLRRDRDHRTRPGADEDGMDDGETSPLLTLPRSATVGVGRRDWRQPRKRYSSFPSRNSRGSQSRDRDRGIKEWWKLSYWRGRRDGLSSREPLPAPPARPPSRQDLPREPPREPREQSRDRRREEGNDGDGDRYR